MPSPFPGMDPYIESCGLWEDFHQKLISELEGTIAQSLPDKYVARLGERAYIVLTRSEDVPEKRLTQTDVAVTSRPASTTDSAAGTAVLDPPKTKAKAIDAPLQMRALISVEFREVFVEIYEMRPERRLVTTIEVLSPANKRHRQPGWIKYVSKREARLVGCLANFVEIDLLRGGQEMPMEDIWPTVHTACWWRVETSPPSAMSGPLITCSRYPKSPFRWPLPIRTSRSNCNRSSTRSTSGLDTTRTSITTPHATRPCRAMT